MTTNLEVVELDFDNIKESFLTYLQNQSEFADYNFTGSALNTLVDAMAYAIHYNGVYANMALSEAFLDSALLRPSVVSKAKEIGYVPSQPRGAKTDFTLRYDDSGDQFFGASTAKIIIPRKTKFNVLQDDGTSLAFVTVDDHFIYDTGLIIGAAATNIYEGTVSIVQGIFGSQSYTYHVGDRYFIDDTNVSDQNLLVSVKPTKDSTSKTVFENEKNITQVTEETNAYFISEVDSKLEIYFGNGDIGVALDENNYITVEYLVTEGSAGNNLATHHTVSDPQITIAQDVYIGNNVALKNNFTVLNPLSTYDGSDIETIKSIKRLAPLDYQRQNRVVTIDDYKTAVLANYSNVQAIHAWGGEDADPPEYGKVFVSIKPKTGDVVSPATKKDIEDNILSKFGVVSIIPEIVDPEYISINLTVKIYYNKDQTTLNKNQLASIVEEAITTHFDDNIYAYDTTFKYSNLVTDIDNSDNAIISNETKVIVSKRFTPSYSGAGTYLLNYSNEIQAGTVYSSTWVNRSTSTSKLIDDGEGNLDLYINNVLFNSAVGTIDYEEGLVTLTNFKAEASDPNEKIRIFAEPENQNVAVTLNNLIVLGDTNITTTPVTR